MPCKLFVAPPNAPQGYLYGWGRFPVDYTGYTGKLYRLYRHPYTGYTGSAIQAIQAVYTGYTGSYTGYTGYTGTCIITHIITPRASIQAIQPGLWQVGSYVIIIPWFGRPWPTARRAGR